MTRESDALGRVLSQFKNTNFEDLLTAAFTQIDDVETSLEYFDENRDIDTAAGVWLDNLGAIVGIERPHRQQPYSTIFAFKDGDDETEYIDDPFKGFYDEALP
jgi:hypothetical protein